MDKQNYPWKVVYSRNGSVLDSCPESKDIEIQVLHKFDSLRKSTSNRLTFTKFDCDQEDSHSSSDSSNQQEEIDTTFIHNNRISKIKTSNLTVNQTLDFLQLNGSCSKEELKQSFMNSYMQVNKKSQKVLEEYRELINNPKVVQTPYYKETTQVRSIWINTKSAAKKKKQKKKSVSFDRNGLLSKRTSFDKEVLPSENISWLSKRILSEDYLEPRRHISVHIPKHNPPKEKKEKSHDLPLDLKSQFEQAEKDKRNLFTFRELANSYLMGRKEERDNKGSLANSYVCQFEQPS